MKKFITLLIMTIFLISCGPRRMSCHGKRCVETTKKSVLQNHQEKKRNS